MLMLEDDSGNSPLQLALDKNSFRVIELILSVLVKLDGFSLLNKVRNTTPNYLVICDLAFYITDLLYPKGCYIMG